LTEPETRFVFCSPEWVRCAGELIRSRLQQIELSGMSASFSEEFTDPPADLATDGGSSIGWHWSVHDGQLQVAALPKRDADIRIVGDYATVLEIARLPNSDERAAALRSKAVAEGRLRVEGQLAPGAEHIQEHLSNMHDALVPFTL